MTAEQLARSRRRRGGDCPTGVCFEDEGEGTTGQLVPSGAGPEPPGYRRVLDALRLDSTIESIGYGVPVICWPFFAEQQTNCRYCCREWGIGMEIEDVERGNIEGLVRKLMEGEKGKEMKKRAMEWKKLAEDAIALSQLNLDKMIEQVLLSPRDINECNGTS
ncbi:hypothetical protein TIFTF001_045739 [Ficus carica]|uniref:Uncharacterized protein n=1 Tax=Ficus carica TaxID=3494 RepID=A0AA87ZE29_FICCA|nr:hypothetical protein TIFTF001_045737 [Ficus carica]GMN22971.1 hypothetical protein TIFTF001_045739 [Ficus carica]